MFLLVGLHNLQWIAFFGFGSYFVAIALFSFDVSLLLYCWNKYILFDKEFKIIQPFA
jgi:hypothetical protein